MSYVDVLDSTVIQIDAYRRTRISEPVGFYAQKQALVVKERTGETIFPHALWFPRTPTRNSFTVLLIHIYISRKRA